MVIEIIFISILGLVLGSFVSALSWRLPRDKSINDGRSICPKCKNQVVWYDNIPILSFILLKGKCRNCGKKISKRYPLIELFTGLTFLVVAMIYFSCSSIVLVDSPVCIWKQSFGSPSLLYLLTISVLMLTIFVIDMEHQIIPDKLVFALLAVVFTTVFVADIYIWERLFAGFLAGLFLLGLHLITFGKGMGLGDGKLAVPIGMFFGLNLMVVWMFSSFLIGSVIGLLLIAINKARFGNQIAFGPFLVLSFFMTLLFGGIIENFIFLY